MPTIQDIAIDLPLQNQGNDDANDSDVNIATEYVR